jgi:hypothetical protein
MANYIKCSEKVHQAVKVRAAQTGMEMQKIAELALESYLSPPTNADGSITTKGEGTKAPEKSSKVLPQLDLSQNIDENSRGEFRECLNQLRELYEIGDKTFTSVLKQTLAALLGSARQTKGLIQRDSDNKRQVSAGGRDYAGRAGSALGSKRSRQKLKAAL